MNRWVTTDLGLVLSAAALFAILFFPLRGPEAAQRPVPPIPPLTSLKNDLPPHALAGCHLGLQESELIECAFGDTSAERTIVIFGDSHAGHWVSALDELGTASSWKIVPFTKAACSFARHEVYSQKKPYRSCEQWRESVIAEILRIQPDIVITTQSYGYREAGKDAIVEGMRSVWSDFIAAGIQVIALEDTPRLSFDPGDCLSTKAEDDCFTPIADARISDNAKVASSIVPAVKYINMMDMICAPRACEAIVGNVVVWRDRHHLTNTYSRTLGPFLASRIGVLIDHENL